MDSVHSSATNTLIELALEEDLGERGDITSKFFVTENATASGRIVAREDCVIAGSEIAELVFKKINPQIIATPIIETGQCAQLGDTIMTISGNARSILSAERTALNFLQRLSGIATLTRNFVTAIRGTGAKILDTRKTTPGWRALEKAAVVAGGGHNHRMGLYDMALLKDNHFSTDLDLKSIQQTIDNFKETYPNVQVELEAENIGQVRDYLKLRNIDIIMLDNMSEEELTEAAVLDRGDVLLEASGGINLDTVLRTAKTGVDLISIGALTHSAVATDLALDFDNP